MWVFYVLTIYETASLSEIFWTRSKIILLFQKIWENKCQPFWTDNPILKHVIKNDFNSKPSESKQHKENSCWSRFTQLSLMLWLHFLKLFRVALNWSILYSIHLLILMFSFTQAIPYPTEQFNWRAMLT